MQISSFSANKTNLNQTNKNIGFSGVIPNPSEDRPDMLMRDGGDRTIYPIHGIYRETPTALTGRHAEEYHRLKRENDPNAFENAAELV